MMRPDELLEKRIASCRTRLQLASTRAVQNVIAAELAKLIAERSPAQAERINREMYASEKTSCTKAKA